MRFFNKLVHLFLIEIVDIGRFCNKIFFIIFRFLLKNMFFFVIYFFNKKKFIIQKTKNGIKFGNSPTVY
jgi:hypothetical protein